MYLGRAGVKSQSAPVSTHGVTQLFDFTFVVAAAACTGGTAASRRNRINTARPKKIRRETLHV